MTIRFRCAKGHKLRSADQDRGRMGICPKCGSSVVVPNVQRELTDTSVVRALGNYALKGPTKTTVAPATAPNQRSYKKCPRCGTLVSANLRICTRCHVYLPAG